MMEEVLKKHDAFQSFAQLLGSQVWSTRNHEVSDLLREPLHAATENYAHGLLPNRNSNGDEWIVEIDLLDMCSFPNAFVAKQNGIYCIGMPYTTPLHFYRLARWLFRDPKILPFIIDSFFEGSGSTTDCPIPFGNFPSTQDLSLSYFNQFCIPGSRRHLVADWIASKAIELVWHHEFGHIVLGHIDYEINLSTNSYQVEKIKSLSDSINNLSDECKIMESYADNWSILVSARAMKLWHDKRGNKIPPLYTYIAFLRLAFWLVSVTWCIGDFFSGDVFTDHLPREHPPSLHRLVFGNKYISEILSQLKTSDEDIVKSNEIYLDTISYIHRNYDFFRNVAFLSNVATEDIFLHEKRYNIEHKKIVFSRWTPYMFMEEEIILAHT